MNSNENKLRILGNKFLLNNKDKCKIIYKEQKYEPKEYFEEIDNNYSKTDFIQIKLRINNDIEDMSHMFENCNQLISISESIEMNNKNINYDFINDNYYSYNSNSSFLNESQAIIQNIYDVNNLFSSPKIFY